jgi:hypothetical protein
MLAVDFFHVDCAITLKRALIVNQQHAATVQQVAVDGLLVRGVHVVADVSFVAGPVAISGVDRVPVTLQSRDSSRTGVRP